MSETLTWNPAAETVAATNLHRLLTQKGFSSYEELHGWSVEQPGEFWSAVTEALNIKFMDAPRAIMDDSKGPLQVTWLPDAKMNIAANCLRPDSDVPAIITAGMDGKIRKISHAELDARSNRIANYLVERGLCKGDAIAIDMPMTADAVAIYLGIIKMGGIVVSIPDSLPPEQIAQRLQIADAKMIFTQDVLPRPGKQIPLYEKICRADAPPAVVANAGAATINLRSQDTWLSGIMVDADPSKTQFAPAECSPQDATNYIFSSGTTATPKCIPWDHTTPIKSASDGRWHQDIRTSDVVCWPTNLGWMMGPWLIYSSLLNGATMALYEGTPTERGFCEFVQDAGVTMLGLVPSIVVAWKNNGTADGLDWQKIRCFSSSGEASNPDDYAWLMQLNQAGDIKPVIEYCGGTEIGGGYISSHMLAPVPASQFNCQALGSRFVILDEAGQSCAPGKAGEVFLCPPAMGLSHRLHNGDHGKAYYDGCAPGLRKHGDRIVMQAGGTYQSDGRADNAMNLNGIKIGSTEIERVVNSVSNCILETAAVGIPPAGGGAEQLVIFAVLKPNAEQDMAALKEEMQKAIRAQLNPQFKLSDLVVIDVLPRTASNKVMHRVLRDQSRQDDAGAPAALRLAQ